MLGCRAAGLAVGAVPSAGGPLGLWRTGVLSKACCPPHPPHSAFSRPHVSPVPSELCFFPSSLGVSLGSWADAQL